MAFTKMQIAIIIGATIAIIGAIVGIILIVNSGGEDSAGGGTRPIGGGNTHPDDGETIAHAVEVKLRTQYFDPNGTGSQFEKPSMVTATYDEVNDAIDVEMVIKGNTTDAEDNLLAQLKALYGETFEGPVEVEVGTGAGTIVVSFIEGIIAANHGNLHGAATGINEAAAQQAAAATLGQTVGATDPPPVKATPTLKERLSSHWRQTINENAGQFGTTDTVRDIWFLKNAQSGDVDDLISVKINNDQVVILHPVSAKSNDTTIYAEGALGGAAFHIKVSINQNDVRTAEVGPLSGGDLIQNSNNQGAKPTHVESLNQIIFTIILTISLDYVA